MAVESTPFMSDRGFHSSSPAKGRNSRFRQRSCRRETGWCGAAEAAIPVWAVRPARGQSGPSPPDRKQLQVIVHCKKPLDCQNLPTERRRLTRLLGEAEARLQGLAS